MKKIFIIVLACSSIFFLTDASAQTTQKSAGASKDKFWGTSKIETRGASTDAADRRAAGLDARWNTYEDGKRNRFSKERIKNSAQMKAIMKQEKRMEKKHQRDKKRLKRRSIR